jgi:CDP-diglyceride synthetase
MGDFSDLLFGFWGTALVIFVPLMLFLAWFARRIVANATGKFLAALLLVFGVLYPATSGLDGDRQNLYLNICGFLFLTFTAWQLAGELRVSSAEPSVSTQPAQ